MERSDRRYIACGRQRMEVGRIFYPSVFFHWLVQTGQWAEAGVAAKGGAETEYRIKIWLLYGCGCFFCLNIIWSKTYFLVSL